jgi:hypothetical protein
LKFVEGAGEKGETAGIDLRFVYAAVMAGLDLAIHDFGAFDLSVNL